MSHIVKDGGGVVKYIFSIGTGSESDPYQMVVQNYERALVDTGKVFLHADRHPVANNATFYYLLKTPAAPAHIELLQSTIETTSSPFEFGIYENALVSANGTAETLWNMNRQSNTSPTALLYISPTVTDIGTEMMLGVISGAKNIGSGITEGYRIILKASTNYLFEYNNVSGASATVALTIMVGED